MEKCLTGTQLYVFILFLTMVVSLWKSLSKSMALKCILRCLYLAPMRSSFNAMMFTISTVDVVCFYGHGQVLVISILLVCVTHLKDEI